MSVKFELEGVHREQYVRVDKLIKGGPGGSRNKLGPTVLIYGCFSPE